MISIFNFKEYISEEMRNKATQYLLGGNIIQMAEDDDGCYDALFHEGSKEEWGEVTLDRDNNIEDYCCPFCGVNFCVHVAAMCYGAQLMMSKGTRDLAKAMDKNNNKI